MILTPLHKMLMRHEGVKLKPYRDTLGILTIGVGRNLDQVGVTAEEALLMLETDILRVTAAVRAVVGLAVFEGLSPCRQAVLVDMGFMGPEKLKEFSGMLAAIGKGDWEQAAKEMLDSRWAAEVKDRAIELAEIMRTDRMIE